MLNKCIVSVFEDLKMLIQEQALTIRVKQTAADQNKNVIAVIRVVDESELGAGR